MGQRGVGQERVSSARSRSHASTAWHGVWVAWRRRRAQSRSLAARGRTRRARPRSQGPWGKAPEAPDRAHRQAERAGGARAPLHALASPSSAGANWASGGSALGSPFYIGEADGGLARGAEVRRVARKSAPKAVPRSRIGMKFGAMGADSREEVDV